jgi:hypothetical protein
MKVWCSRNELILNRKHIFGDSRFASQMDEIFNFEMFESILYRMNPANLKKIDFSDYKSRLESDGNECLDLLSKNCPNLTHVSFNGLLKKNNFKLNEACFRNFTISCSKLTDIDLSSCCITDSSMVDVFSNCSNLEYLNLFGCSQLTGVCFENMTQSLVKLVLEEC